MWGAIAGAALGAAGSIWGNIQAASAARKAKRRIEKEQKENENWYNRRYNEDATQRADAQRIMTRTEDAIRQRNRAAAGRQAVTGGTEESTAATKAANASALADATSQIAAKGDARKDTIESQYRTSKSNLDNQMVGVENTRAQNITDAVGGMANAAGGLIAYDALGGKAKDTTATGGTSTRAASMPTPDPNSGTREDLFKVAQRANDPGMAAALRNAGDDYGDVIQKYINDNYIKGTR